MADEPVDPQGQDADAGSDPQQPDPTAGPPAEGESLSQADIDAALSSQGGGEAAQSPGEAADSGPLSQSDIDALKEQVGESESTVSGEEMSGGDLSQADIDAALNAQAGGEPSPTADAGASSGQFSQADIDAALAGGSGDSQAEVSQSDKPQAEAVAGSGASGMSPQDEIDAVLAQAASETEEPAGSAAEVADSRLDSAGRPFDAAAAAMAAAIEEDAASPSDPAPETRPVSLPDFADEDDAHAERDISMLRDVDLKVHIELGRTMMYIEDVLKLTEGSVVELDNLAGDPVDVYVNGRLVARGEVLVLSDNFCVRVSEIVSGLQHVSVA